jgi:hypothetical protein
MVAIQRIWIVPHKKAHVIWQFDVVDEYFSHYIARAVMCFDIVYSLCTKDVAEL